MYLLDVLPAQIRSVSVRKSASGNTLNKIFNVSVNACSHFHSLSTTSTSLISVTRSLIHTQRSFIGQHQHSVFSSQILVFLMVFSSTVTKQVRFECLAERLMVSGHSILMIRHSVPHSFPHPLPLSLSASSLSSESSFSSEKRWHLLLQNEIKPWLHVAALVAHMSAFTEWIHRGKHLAIESFISYFLWVIKSSKLYQSSRL